MAGAFALAVSGMIALDIVAPIEAMHYETLRILSSLRQWLHTGATVCLGAGILVAIDLVLLPWMDLHEAVRGSGEWASVPVAVRAAAVGGWYLLAAAILVSVTQGVVAL